MIKIGLLGFNLLILLAYQLFLGGDVKVTQDFPTEIEAGKSFQMVVTFEKGDLAGFAKWQQTLPIGFTAKPLNTGNATFSFKNNEIKLIWMALPTTETFEVSYELRADKSIKGKFNLDGKFSFIEDNERKDIKSPTQSLHVIEENSRNDKVVAEVENSKENKLDTTTISTKIDDNKLITNTKQLKISREINYIGDRHYRVTLTIQKAHRLNSFGKIEEYIPGDFKAKEIQREDGSFSFRRGVMKILWRALPDANNLLVSYEIISKSGELDSATIHGVFSYLDGNIAKQVAMEGTTFINHYNDKMIDKLDSLKEIAEASKPPKLDRPEEKVDSIKLNDPKKVLALEKDEFAAEENAIVPRETTEEGNSVMRQKSNKSKEQKLVEATTNIPSAETSVNYKVQIAAAKKEVGQEYFKKRHHIIEPVEISFYHNWYNYSVGLFPIYKEARNKRNKIWAADNKINDAFVTAYNAGERISVQEALMVTKQKWYK